MMMWMVDLSVAVDFDQFDVNKKHLTTVDAKNIGSDSDGGAVDYCCADNYAAAVDDNFEIHLLVYDLDVVKETRQIERNVVVNHNQQHICLE